MLIEHAAVPQSSVTFGQAGPKRDDPDWYAAYILNDVIGGAGFRGRLMQEIREKRGLAYGVSTELVPYRHAGLILGSVATENSRVAESIALIRAEWQRMHDAGPSEAELQEAKDYLIGSFPLSLDSTRRIAATLVQLQIDKLGIDYLDRRAGLLGGVTLQQARDVARKLYDPAGLSFAVVGNPAGLEPTRAAPEPSYKDRRPALQTPPPPNPPPSRGRAPGRSCRSAIAARGRTLSSSGASAAAPKPSPSMGEGLGGGLMPPGSLPRRMGGWQ